MKFLTSFLGIVSLIVANTFAIPSAEARFLQTDPVGYGDHMNMYLYARNDPVNLVDPNGENPVAGAIAGCAATGPACPVGAIGGAIVGTLAAVALILAANEISDGGSDQPGVPLDDIPDASDPDFTDGTREIGDLEPIHSGDLNPNADDIRDLPDDELMGSITDPQDGQKVKVKGNKVLDGNTRVEEGKKRFPPETEIPVEETKDQ